MENEKSLVKQENPQSFIERLIEHAEDLEKIKEVGMVIINSGFCPEHFKQSKDAVGAIMCIEAGRKLGLTWMQSLSDIYPVKGRIGIMGSAARAVIFSSGVLDKWEEQTEGNYPEDTYKHIILSKRKGLPGEFRSEFSVLDAKKAGLFGKDIYQRYGKRLIMWRNVGFHSTDYYGDIMKGMKTVEELTDFDIIPGVGDTTIEKEDGTKINIIGGSKQKSTKMTDRVADKIPDNKFGAVSTTIQDAVVIEPARIEPVIDENEMPFKAEKGSSEFMDGKEVIRDEHPVNDAPEEIVPGKYTLKQLEDMDTEVLKKMVMDDMDMMESAEIIGGKNTNKKLREIYFAWQSGTLAEYMAPRMPKEETSNKTTQFEQRDSEIPVNKSFDKATKEKKIDDFLNATTKIIKKNDTDNKYGIVIEDIGPNGNRDFASTKTLFNQLAGVDPSINAQKYLELATKLGFADKFKDKEVFCRVATITEIDLLLNAN